MLLCTARQERIEHLLEFDAVSKAVFALEPIPSPAQRCLIYLLHLQKKKFKKIKQCLCNADLEAELYFHMFFIYTVYWKARGEIANLLITFFWTVYHWIFPFLIHLLQVFLLFQKTVTTGSEFSPVKKQKSVTTQIISNNTCSRTVLYYITCKIMK